MRRNIICIVFVSLFFSSFLYGAEPYYEFKLGQHIINGNKITFEFPENSQSLYLFSDMWKDFQAEKMKLSVTLYDNTYKLITSSESLCVEKRKSGLNSFGSIVFPEVTMENINKVAFFSLRAKDCTVESPKVISLDESRPEVKFARQIVDAIKQGKQAYFALFSSQPDSEESIRIEETIFNDLQGILNNNGEIISVYPLDEEYLQKTQNICTEPYFVKIERKQKTAENIGGDEVPVTSSEKMLVVIGKVKGIWKIIPGL